MHSQEGLVGACWPPLVQGPSLEPSPPTQGLRSLLPALGLGSVRQSGSGKRVLYLAVFFHLKLQNSGQHPEALGSTHAGMPAEQSISAKRGVALLAEHTPRMCKALGSIRRGPAPVLSSPTQRLLWKPPLSFRPGGILMS